MDSEMIEKNKWKLESIKIERKMFGEFKGQYFGTIEFQNGERESFRFKIPSNMVDRYLELLSDDIVSSANQLGKDLLKSLGLNRKKGDLGPS